MEDIMKKGFAIILIVFLSCGALFATVDTSNNNVDVTLDISGSSVTDIGFASKAVEDWATDPTPIPASSISLSPNMADGSFSYVGSGDSGLFAYARIQSGNAVDIRLKSTQLKGYANNVEVTGAELNWIVKPVVDSGSYNTTNFTAQGTTFNNTTTTTGNIFTHGAATCHAGMPICFYSHFCACGTSQQTQAQKIYSAINGFPWPILPACQSHPTACRL